MSGTLGIVLAGADPVVAVTSTTVSSTVSSPTNAFATYELNVSGIVNKITNAGTSPFASWIIPNNAGKTPYTVRATVTSGALTSGDPTGSDIALTSTRSWTVLQTVVGTGACTLTIDLKKNGNIVSTATITFSARVL